MNARAHNHIIAVVGGSGAGKSWLVTQLCRLVGDKACRLSLDDFYRDRSHLPPARRARLNFDVPQAIDWTGAAEVLRHSRLGRPAQIPQYDFATFSRRPAAHAWEPRPIIFAEGLWLLRSPDLRPLFDFSLYLDTPATLRGERRLARDTSERGYTEAAVRRRLIESVLPMHGRYVEPQKRWADLVLAQPYRADEVKNLADHLWPRLTGVGALPSWGQETFRAELLSLLCEHEYAN